MTSEEKAKELISKMAWHGLEEIRFVILESMKWAREECLKEVESAFNYAYRKIKEKNDSH